MLVAEKNRLGRSAGAVHPRIEAHITWLEKELKDLDQDLREMLLRSPVWRHKDDLLRSVPGVGEQVSVSLLAYFPELGELDRKQIAPLSEWPHQHEQRDCVRQPHCMGRPVASEAALYMGTLVATRYNSVIRIFYQRLPAGGKGKKVALVVSQP